MIKALEQRASELRDRYESHAGETTGVYFIDEAYKREKKKD